MTRSIFVPWALLTTSLFPGTHAITDPQSARKYLEQISEQNLAIWWQMSTIQVREIIENQVKKEVDKLPMAPGINTKKTIIGAAMLNLETAYPDQLFVHTDSGARSMHCK